MLKILLSAVLAGLTFYIGWLVNDVPWGVKLIPPDAVLPDGSRYYGATVKGFWHGEGEWVGADGTRYKGEFAGGLFHGRGKMWLMDGVYVGEFEQGVIQGKGELDYDNGAKYKGDFIKNRMHGQGVLSFEDGRTYTGEFIEGKFARGEFLDGMGNAYVGEMKDGFFHGRGIYKTLEGEVYEGEFEEGLLHGEGTVAYADGSHYKGGIDAWTYSGKGVLRDAEGNVYEGHFEHGEYHGAGTLTLAEPVGDVTVLKGNWEYGYLADDPRYKRPDYSKKIEALLYSQESLLQASLNQVQTGVAGRIDVFFVGLAGYGRQDVFLKEINTIEQKLSTENIIANRAVTLVNHFDTVESRPLATLTGLKKVLHGVQEKMNVDEDILFLYLTSHGSKDHHFSIRLDGVNLPSIVPEELGEALSQTAIKHKVVIISACYSGGFLDALSGPDTLVITAARSDRKSFGCGDDSDMTYFGDAFFNRALSQTQSFTEAFKLASALVAERESEEFPDSERSEPQMVIGKAIREHLSVWQSQNFRREP